MLACRMLMGRGRSSAGGGSADRNSLPVGAREGLDYGRGHTAGATPLARPKGIAPEVWVRPLGQLVHHLLQRPRRPLYGQVGVLQQQPAAALVRRGQRRHRDRLLALAQRHGAVLAGLRGEPQPRAQRLDAGGLVWEGGGGRVG
jgi:hypothetical protein